MPHRDTNSSLFLRAFLVFVALASLRMRPHHFFILCVIASSTTSAARVRARAMFVCGILFSWNEVRVARCRYYILSRIAFCSVRDSMRKGATKSAQSKLCLRVNVLHHVSIVVGIMRIYQQKWMKWKWLKTFSTNRNSKRVISVSIASCSV